MRCTTTTSTSTTTTTSTSTTSSRTTHAEIKNILLRRLNYSKNNYASISISLGIISNFFLKYDFITLY